MDGAVRLICNALVTVNCGEFGCDPGRPTLYNYWPLSWPPTSRTAAAASAKYLKNTGGNDCMRRDRSARTREPDQNGTPACDRLYIRRAARLRVGAWRVLQTCSFVLTCVSQQTINKQPTLSYCPPGLSWESGRFLTKMGMYFNHVSTLYRTVSYCINVYLSDSDDVTPIQVSPCIIMYLARIMGIQRPKHVSKCSNMYHDVSPCIVV